MGNSLRSNVTINETKLKFSVKTLSPLYRSSSFQHTSQRMHSTRVSIENSREKLEEIPSPFREILKNKSSVHRVTLVHLIFA